jgi:hypothetical protein
MSSPSDGIETWVTAFKSIWIACGMVDTQVKLIHWNPFANATTGTYLPGLKAQTPFFKALQEQFAANDLASYTINKVMVPSDKFFDYTNKTVGYLQGLVHDLIEGFCPAGPPSFNPSGSLATATLLTLAFPNGVTDPNWLQILRAVEASGLDKAIDPKATSTAESQLISGTDTIANLIATLSTI